MVVDELVTLSLIDPLASIVWLSFWTRTTKKVKSSRLISFCYHHDDGFNAMNSNWFVSVLWSFPVKTDQQVKIGQGLQGTRISH